MFDWDDLKHFLAAAREGSTTAAAKALGVSQSTVQRRLEEFEKRIGRQVVTRGVSGYKLTELGRDLLAHAERVEDEILAFERRLSAAGKDLSGTVRVTCPEAVGVRLMRSRLRNRFHAEFPVCRWSLSSATSFSIWRQQQPQSRRGTDAERPVAQYRPSWCRYAVEAVYDSRANLESEVR